jgi:nucleotide-binding universal stress UspA family protein
VSYWARLASQEVRVDEPLIVVPLDGSPLAEGALPYARLLAEAAGGKLLLVTTWAGANGELQAVLPRVRASLTERAKRHYRGYLRTVADGLKRDGFAVETRFALGYPVDEIPALLRRRRPAYLVLATHGRSGLSRAWYGSVATRLVREASVPTRVVGPALLRRRARRPSV